MEQQIQEGAHVNHNVEDASIVSDEANAPEINPTSNDNADNASVSSNAEHQSSGRVNQFDSFGHPDSMYPYNPSHPNPPCHHQGQQEGGPNSQMRMNSLNLVAHYEAQMRDHAAAFANAAAGAALAAAQLATSCNSGHGIGGDTATMHAAVVAAQAAAVAASSQVNGSLNPAAGGNPPFHVPRFGGPFHGEIPSAHVPFEVAGENEEGEHTNYPRNRDHPDPNPQQHKPNKRHQSMHMQPQQRFFDPNQEAHLAHLMKQSQHTQYEFGATSPFQSPFGTNMANCVPNHYMGNSSPQTPVPPYQRGVEYYPYPMSMESQRHQHAQHQKFQNNEEYMATLQNVNNKRRHSSSSQQPRIKPDFYDNHTHPSHPHSKRQIWNHKAPPPSSSSEKRSSCKVETPPNVNSNCKRETSASVRSSPCNTIDSSLSSISSKTKTTPLSKKNYQTNSFHSRNTTLPGKRSGDTHCHSSRRRLHSSLDSYSDNSSCGSGKQSSGRKKQFGDRHSPRSFNPVGKTGVAALHELCSKRHWDPPKFIETHDVNTSTTGGLTAKETKQGDSQASSTPLPVFREFFLSVFVEGNELGRGRGSTKSAARQDASRKALKVLLPNVAFDANGILLEVVQSNKKVLLHPSELHGLAPLASRLAIHPHLKNDCSKDASVSCSNKTTSKPPNYRIYPSASSGVSSASEDEDSYFSKRGASVCSTLLHAMWQINDKIKEPPSYSFDACVPEALISSSKRRALVDAHDGGAVSSSRRVASTKNVNVHRSSFLCTVVIYLRRESSSKEKSVLEEGSPGDDTSGTYQDHVKDSECNSVLPGAVREETDVASDQTSPQEHEDSSQKEEEVIGKLQAASDGMAKREANDPLSEKSVQKNTSENVERTSHEGEKTLQKIPSLTTVLAKRETKPTSSQKLVQKNNPEKAEDDSHTGEETLQKLQAVGTGATKREAKHAASAKLLALLFPSCRGMVEVVTAAEASREKYAASKAMTKQHKKALSLSAGSKNHDQMKGHVIDESCNAPTPLDDLKRRKTENLSGIASAVTVKEEVPSASPHPDNFLSIEALSLSELHDNRPKPQSVEQRKFNRLFKNTISKANGLVLEEGRLGFDESDLEKVPLRRISRQRQFENEVDSTLQKLSEINDDIHCSLGDVSDDDIGKIVLRRSRADDNVWIKNHLQASANKVQEIDQIGHDSSFISSPAVCSNTSVHGTFVTLNAGLLFTTTAGTPSFDDVSVTLILSRAIAAGKEPPLGCAVISEGFSTKNGRVLRVIRIAHESHLPYERFVERLEAFASKMKCLLEIRRNDLIPPIADFSPFTKSFVGKASSLRQRRRFPHGGINPSLDLEALDTSSNFVELEAVKEEECEDVSDESRVKSGSKHQRSKRTRRR